MPRLELDPEQAAAAAAAVRDLARRCADLRGGRALSELAEVLPGGALADAARSASARVDIELDALARRLQWHAAELARAAEETVALDARLVR